MGPVSAPSPCNALGADDPGRRGSWRPTFTFMAELSARLGEVDARLGAR